jgi:hypothetical protein
MKDYRAAAAEWGVSLELKPYTDEKTAAEDLKAGKCQVALLTGLRVRSFNRFSGTIEALGAIQDYAMLEKVVALTASPKLARLMQSDGYETVGVLPAGAVYLHLRDREWQTLSELAGKRIATMDYDPAAVDMVSRAGATLVPADVGTFAGMFNNGSVDICYAPATAFKPLELGKGLKKGGGLIRNYPTAQLTLQLLARRDASLPETYGQQSRQWAATHFDQAIGLVEKAEKSIPQKFWVDIPKKDLPRYDSLFRDLRVSLKGKEYDGTMLTLLRRVRCQRAPDRAECAEKKE